MKHLCPEDRPIWDAALEGIRTEFPELAPGLGAHSDLAMDDFARDMHEIRASGTPVPELVAGARLLARLAILKSCLAWEKTKRGARERCTLRAVPRGQA